jgi:predicted transcriptional regulator
MSKVGDANRQARCTPIFVDREVNKQLKLLAAAKGTTIQALTERALHQWVRRQIRAAERRYAQSCQRAG